ncbi:LLM class flavin-dependent oxidoreductase [Nocardia camponoti]|uniref:Alkanesulfonate monooxygenase n=1 Tax=Nocardia camponoti TaxID=1616106 RepID=A0A917Q916_9NOCA|nr:LLM class flavin-dependent oxidoreductase [Nocardia camponoti]GGK36220.1 alkanesulfonate monooxygenase [Nocardia camponoti]
MSPEIYSFLSSSPAQYPWENNSGGYPHLVRDAQAIDDGGYAGALVATGIGAGPDPWVTSASVIGATSRMKFLLAIHPTVTTPATLAKQVATFDELSNGRILTNIVTGSLSNTAGRLGGTAAAGVALDHDARYRYTDEFLHVYKELISGRGVDFAGEFISITGGFIGIRPVQKPYPPIWFGGSSDAAIEVAAKHADVYATWGEPWELLTDKISRARAAAAKQGRTIKVGCQFNVIVRDTKEEAWAAAQELLDRADDGFIEKFLANLAAGDSVGQLRQLGFHAGKRPTHARELEIEPDIWSGFGLLRVGPGLAIVGDPETVAARLRDYAAAGIDAFILQNWPYVEETERIARDVLPLLTDSLSRL